MDPFLWLVGFVIFAESAFFLGILFVLAFYGFLEHKLFRAIALSNIFRDFTA